jgi:tetratricopeptide (TPR) repeat protein
MQAYQKAGNETALKTLAASTLQLAPDNADAKNYLQNVDKVNPNDTLPTAEKYLDQSLAYFNTGNYEKCIEAANQALVLKPGYDLAYNNICAAYNRLQNWGKAVIAGEKGAKKD